MSPSRHEDHTSDHANSATESLLTAEERAAWDAYEAGADAPALSAQEIAVESEREAAGADAGKPTNSLCDIVDPNDATANSVEANKRRFVRYGDFPKERAPYGRRT